MSTEPLTQPGDTVQAKCPVSHAAPGFNPFDDEYLLDPYRVFSQIRQEEPVFYNAKTGYWVVSKYEDIVAIFRDPETYSAKPAVQPHKAPCPAAIEKLLEVDWVPNGMLVDEDPPIHTKRRRVLRRGLTKEQIDTLEPYARQYATECLDRLVKNGSADIVRELTYEVPALIAFRLMGVPEAEVQRVKQFAARLALFLWGEPTDEEQVQLAEAFAKYYEYAREHVERLIESPGDDYMSNAIKDWQRDGTDEKWNKAYLASVMQGQFYAAHETTTDATAAGFKALLEHRDQWEMICQQPSLIPQAVEEILRYSSSVPAWRRTTTRQVIIGGVEIGAGETLLILTGSANHDQDKFVDGEDFDMTRANAGEHLAFGFGIHACLGQNLARMEMRVMLEEATKRLPHLRLVEGQEWSYSRNFSFRGPARVFVEWDPAQNPLPGDRP